MITIPFKRGDTFTLSCTYKVDGVPTQLPAGIRAQLRTASDRLISELTLGIVDAAAGTYTLTDTATDSALWPTATIFGDIQYTDSQGNVSSTDTFQIPVAKDITHD